MDKEEIIQEVNDVINVLNFEIIVDQLIHPVKDLKKMIKPVMIRKLIELRTMHFDKDKAAESRLEGKVTKTLSTNTHRFHCMVV